MKTRIAFLIGIAFILHGCIASIYPLYTPETEVFEPLLLGEWTESGDQENIWKFEKLVQGDGDWLGLNKGKEKAYKLFWENEEETGEFEVRLVKLGEYYFMDFFSDEYIGDLPDIYSITPPIPTHSFARVTFSEEEMRLHFFDYEWLKKLFEQKKIRIKHETAQDGTILLTASSEELQKFVVKYAEEEDAYIDPTILRK